MYNLKIVTEEKVKCFVQVGYSFNKPYYVIEFTFAEDDSFKHEDNIKNYDYRITKRISKKLFSKSAAN